MNKQKKIKAVACVLIVTLLTGCWSARELNALSIVIGIGVDKQLNVANNVLLTAEIVKPDELKSGQSSGGGGGGGSQPYWNLQSDADTVFDAIREFTHLTNNKLYSAHAQVIVMGRDIAEEGIQPYLDFFIRAVETRPTMLIAISDTTAEQVLNVKPELDKLPAVNITKLIKAQNLTSYGMDIDMQDFVEAMLSKTKSFTAPLVYIMVSDGKDVLSVQQMAVFKRDKMIGELSYEESRGLIWTLGYVKTGVIDVDYADGTVSFEVKSADSSVDAKMENGQLKVKIKVTQKCNLSAQTCTCNVATISEFAVLEGLINDAVKSEIMAAVAKAKGLKADVFGFGELVSKHPPEGWSDIENNWDSIFPKMDVEVEVKSTILTSGLITKPAEPES